jgi:hypothetical protein
MIITVAHAVRQSEKRAWQASAQKERALLGAGAQDAGGLHARAP